MTGPADEETCPRCDSTLSGERVCPACGLEIRTAADEISSDATEAIVANALSQAGDVNPPPSRTLPYPIRLATALAISIPFGPLSAFALTSVVPAPSLAVVLVGMTGWMASAAVLARAAVPSLIVGRGLTVLGILVAVAPLLTAAGRILLGENAVGNPPIDGSDAIVGSFLGFGVLILALGLLITRVGVRKRQSWRDDVVTHRDDRS